MIKVKINEAGFPSNPAGGSARKKWDGGERGGGRPQREEVPTIRSTSVLVDNLKIEMFVNTHEAHLTVFC